MQINFFEEYPTPENMTKLGLVTWNCTVLVAAPSLAEFENIREEYSLKHTHITFGWWPILPGSYWISGFSNPKDLDIIFTEILSVKSDNKLPILLDLELPRNLAMYLKNFFNLNTNKRKLKNFLQRATENNLKIYAAEYPAVNKTMLRIWKFCGISPSFELPHTKLPMCYSSMLIQMFGKKIWQKVKTFENKFLTKNIGRVSCGLGTIATGILGNEPILSPENLAEDLKWAKKSGAREVFIFRLGGLNESYISVINSVNE